MTAYYSSPTASEHVINASNLTSSDGTHIDRRFQEEMLSSRIIGSRGEITEVKNHDGSTERLQLQAPELVVSPPKMESFKEHFNAIQKWEGKVISLSDDTFKATLSPIVGDSIEQEAEIYLEDVTPDERSFIEPGAVFYWSIGYLTRPSGRVRESVLRFRRLPMWTENDMKKRLRRGLEVSFEDDESDGKVSKGQ